MKGKKFETPDERYDRITKEMEVYCERNWGYDCDRAFGPVDLWEYEDEIKANPNITLNDVLAMMKGDENND